MKHRRLTTLTAVVALVVAACGGAVTTAPTLAPTGRGRFAGSYSGGLDQMLVYVPEQAAGLKETAPFVSYGNGKLGPLDNGVPSVFDPGGGDEAGVAVSGATFVQLLKELKIPVTVDAYGSGTHDPKYWQRELERSFPLVLKALRE